jgi:hypothetical protein
MIFVNPGLTVRTGLLLQVTVAAGRLAMAAGAVVSAARAVDELGIHSVDRVPILSPVGAGSERIEIFVASCAGKRLLLQVAGLARIHVAGTRGRHAILLIIAPMAVLTVDGLVTAVVEHEARQSRTLGPSYLAILCKVTGGAVVARFLPIADIVTVLTAPRAPFHGYGNLPVLAVAVGAIHFVLTHVKSVAEQDGWSRPGLLTLCKDELCIDSRSARLLHGAVNPGRCEPEGPEGDPAELFP